MSDLKKIVQALADILPSDDEAFEKARAIEARSHFRAPEVRESSWVDMAQLIRSIPVDKLAQFLINQSSAVSFTEKEKVEVRAALSKRRSDLDQFEKSPKLNDKERKEARDWINFTNSASNKLEQG